MTYEIHERSESGILEVVILRDVKVSDALRWPMGWAGGIGVKPKSLTRT